MKRSSINKSFESLQLVGMAIDRCHVTEGSLVRVYFRLSVPPPLGWSYIFTTTWQAVQYPLKRQAGVEGDMIWIECLPEEIASNHFVELEKALAQTDEKYRARLQHQSLRTRHQTQLDAEILSQLDNLNQALYPADVSATDGIGAPHFWGSVIFAKLKELLRLR